MRTLFIGGGQGCLEVLALVEQGRLASLGIRVVAVVDVDEEAPALRYAEEKGWQVLQRLEDGLALPGLELVIELTGSDEVLDRVHRHVPAGVRVIDHVMARVFWDLEKVAGELREELRIRTELRAEAARDRMQLQYTVDAIPDLILVLDKQMRIMRVNQRFERLTGKYRGQVHGKTVREVFGDSKDDSWSADFIRLFDEITEHGVPTSVLRARKTRSGRDAYFQIAANPIFDEDLDIVRVVLTAREVTEQVKLRRETEESARHFKQIVDAVHGLITIKDREGRYVLVNPWAGKLAGIPREEMIGKTAEELFPQETVEQILELDREALAKGSRHVSEEVLTLDGTKRVFVSERLPLKDYQGEVVGICCVRQDRTRRRRLQKELIQTERLAAIGKLAAGVAHEINNPLSGILTFAQDLLLEAGPDDPARPDYELIVGETLRCRRIVRDLLEFSRQRSLKRQRVEMEELVSRVLPLVERQATFHDIVFDVSIAEDLPALHVDLQQMQQVLLNLVINARDAMNARGTIRIRGEPADDGRSVALSVSDSGCGIPESELNEIFELFHSTKGDMGHGLGLTAVRSVIERHGGRIEVNSEVDAGTTFRVTIPAAWE